MRKEIKFELNREEYYNIKKIIDKMANENQTIMKKEEYSVKTVYFENIYNSIMQGNIDGNPNREKYRIRMYNNNLNDLFLEKKIKRENGIFKYREKITKTDVTKIYEDKIDDFINQTELKRDFYINVKTKLLKPKIIVYYDRVAFEHHLTNCRITLDSNVSKNNVINDFFKENKKTSNIYKFILEVKYEEFIPKYIWELLKINMQRQKSSKYLTMRLSK